MKKIFLLTLLAVSFISCVEDEDICYKPAHVNENPEQPDSFVVELQYPYDCDTGEPLQDLYRSQKENANLTWISWGK